LFPSMFFFFFFFFSLLFFFFFSPPVFFFFFFFSRGGGGGGKSGKEQVTQSKPPRFKENLGSPLRFRIPSTVPILFELRVEKKIHTSVFYQEVYLR